ncbi:helix-turn-helix domain-containing protein [Novosphingobium cyanobacteriorum]|uniref:AraC family transcriptional regulator n=1 Tax=Novosphingobium cyanobacteriorum TaxID=3024215 RepID=A0ABT6CI66_9SPHN|nr:AraC family transcriptional regulator [Novosphingobium cyanobacteriorum]MDF8332042.1 AraC family transcriptional regulator [Novosphingobium cyanobacteriorum]
MTRKQRPAVDRSIASGGGVTRDGQPISYNRAPADDLAPWIARLYVTKVDMPAEYRLNCGLFNDAACIRIQLRGQWTADTADGRMEMGKSALFFGPQSRRMPISVTGSFISVGAMLRPGACHVLKGPKVPEIVDWIVPMADAGGNPDEWFSLFAPDAEPEAWCLAMEDRLRTRIAVLDAPEPDPATTRFEAAAFADPTISIKQFAERAAIEQRRLERIIRRDFGMPPKQVLRRARALDMASHLRGVADKDEAEALALRYYDQSHLIREFSELFGMSPRQFVETPQPLMTLALETRQARRLEMMARIAPGEIRPWE